MIDRLDHRLKSLGDFVNVQGDIVLLYGCSYVDLTEFVDRVDKIRKAVQTAPLGIDGEQLSFDSLMADKLFRQNVARCLELHGLSLVDVSLRHIQDLLLYTVDSDDNGQPVLSPGLLVKINTPRTQKEQSDETTVALGGDPTKDSYERALAVIATHTKSVAEAIALTKQMSALQLGEYLEQSSDLQRQIAEASVDTAKDSEQDLLAKLDKYCDE